MFKFFISIVVLLLMTDLAFAGENPSDTIRIQNTKAGQPKDTLSRHIPDTENKIAAPAKIEPIKETPKKETKKQTTKTKK